MSDAKLIQLDSARKDKQESIRRQYERVLFGRILGCYTVIEKLGLKSVEVFDISKGGMNFRMPKGDGVFAIGEEMEFRFYFSNNTYVPARITVRRVSESFENGLLFCQYGCTFDTSLSNFDAIAKFVDFIQAYSVAAKEDNGSLPRLFL